MPTSSAETAARGERRLLVFTDLDGTLLDHDTYSWEPAANALERLRRGGHLVVPTTSKTLAEVLPLRRALGLDGPAITENGAVLALPSGHGEDLQLHRFSPPYAEIVAQLQELREREALAFSGFSGFSDLSDTEVAALTGLSPSQARDARRRDGSEPIRWLDAPERLAILDRELAPLGLRRITGGRFHHVLGVHADKALAMAELRRWLAGSGSAFDLTVALGDGPNDLDMLAAADRAVLVANPKAPDFDTAHLPRLIRTQAAGPVGWAETMHTLLDQRQAEEIL